MVALCLLACLSLLQHIRNQSLLLWTWHSRRRLEHFPYGTLRRVYAIFECRLWLLYAAHQGLCGFHTFAYHEREEVPLVTLRHAVSCHHHGDRWHSGFTSLLQASQSILESIARYLWQFHDGSEDWLCLDSCGYLHRLGMCRYSILDCAQAADVPTECTSQFPY